MAVSLNPFAVPRTSVQWAVDALLFLVAVAVWWLYGFGIAGFYTGIPDWFWPVDWALGAVACLLLWWTRSHPVAVAVLVLVPGAFAVTAFVPLVVAIFRLAKFARPRTTVLLTALHIVTALPYHVVFPLPGMDLLTWLLVAPLIYLLAMTLGLLGRSRRLVIEGLAAAAEHARERYEAELAGLRRLERERIASEMHDVLAHRISLVSVHAGALEYRTSPTSGETPSAAELHDAAGVIRENAHLAIEELRQVLAILRSDDAAGIPTAPPQPRFADVPRLLEDAERAGQRVEATIDPDAEAGLTAGGQRSVYRVIQEGLTNARKHAPGTRVGVRVAALSDRTLVEVTNPMPIGVTASEIPGVGTGLAGLAERVAVEGGTFEHGIVDGDFRLAVTLPRRSA